VSGVGGYVRRKDRHHEPYGLHTLENCPYCGISYEDVRAGRTLHPLNDGLHPATSAPPPLRFEPLPAGTGEILHNILSGGDPKPGPPWTHTIVPAGPIGELEAGTPVYPEPGPAFTVSDGPVYLDSYLGPAFPPQRAPDWQAGAP
jgi:hypothetical protein